jgi:L-alanine-DL-glutamate epimerase-like enolase superfamily enzyme
MGRDAHDGSRRIWKDLFFPRTPPRWARSPSLALAAIDTALWDLKPRTGLPLQHGGRRRAGGSVPVYTDRGRLAAHRHRRRWSTRRSPRKAAGLRRLQDQGRHSRPSPEDVGAAFGGARGRRRPRFEVMIGRQPGIHRG